MKIIIAGIGKVGDMLAKQLSAEGYDLTLVDSNQNISESMIEKYDVMTLNGNCATMPVLRQAGVENAELLIAVSNADEINLLCCMTAHNLNPNIHTIARIRNPEYTEQIYQMRNAFGLSLYVNPEKQAAEKIANLLRFPGFLKRESFAKDRVEIVELRVDANSKLNGVSLSDLNNIVKCQILVCVVLRNKTAIMPNGRFVLEPEDRIYVTAPTNVLAFLLKNLGIITKKVSRVILAGGGRVSYYLADDLERGGIDVEIIEKDRERCTELAAMLPTANIVLGDASSQSMLESEGMSECDAVVSLTGLDEMNIVISLYAADMGIPQVITKLGHAEDTMILSRLPIGSVVCPKELCCNTIIRYVRAIHNQSGAAVSVHSIASGLAEAVEFSVDPSTKNCNTPLKSIKIKKNVLIVCISHSGKTEIPNGDSMFHQGDTVIVVTNKVLMQLNDIFE